MPNPDPRTHPGPARLPDDGGAAAAAPHARPSRPIGRRAFLRLAASAGAALAAAAGLGAGSVLPAGCGGDTTATTTGGGAVTTSTTGAAPATTSTSAAVELAGAVTVGFVAPLSGTMAEARAAITWHLDWFAKNLWKDGLVMGDGKRHPVIVALRDSGSDMDQSARHAQSLVLDEKVVLLGAVGGAATVLPVREVAEQFGCPCVTCDCPGEAWSAGQPEGGFAWSWHTWFVLRDVVTDYLAMWEALSTNKVVGGLYPDDADGNAFAAALPAAAQAKGYQYVDPGRYKAGAGDFSGIIKALRSAGVEILTGAPSAADYAVFWRQAMLLGFHPKASTQAKALLSPAGAGAFGELGVGQSAECWFHPAFPYASTATGLTARQVCDRWEQDKGVQWSQALGYFGLLEVWSDVLARAADPFDKLAIVDAIRQTKVTTVGGPVDWTVNPEPYSSLYNFSTRPVAAGQWVKGAGKWPYDLQIVASATQPEIPVTAAVKELTYPA